MQNSRLRNLVCTLRRMGVAALAAFGMLTQPSEASAQTKLKEQTIYYAVSGTTARSLYANMLRNGPRGDRGRALGTTKGVMQPRMVYEQRGNTCRLKTFTLSVDIITRLPKLAPGQKLSGPLRAQWNNLAVYVRQHEGRHRAIFLSCARRISQRISAIGPAASCDTLQSLATNIGRQEHLNCSRLHDAFDKQEVPRIKNLPLVRQAAADNRTGQRKTATARPAQTRQRKSTLVNWLSR